MPTRDEDWQPSRRRAARRRPGPTSQAKNTKKGQQPVVADVPAADVTPAQSVPHSPMAKPLRPLTPEERREREQAVCLLN